MSIRAFCALIDDLRTQVSAGVRQESGKINYFSSWLLEIRGLCVPIDYLFAVLFARGVLPHTAHEAVYRPFQNDICAANERRAWRLIDRR
jgi:hypothetical protein